jgi:phosphoribosylaminoimidazolecarboxamide formyltransferase/IMP cyclohydrolase
VTKERKINSALISVFSKDGLDDLVKQLNQNGVVIYSTGGTQAYIENLGIHVIPVEELTDYPSILGGRVKTLHPKVFGGILSRRDNKGDESQLKDYGIPNIDLVVVDLYPFEDTVSSGAEHQDVIEKIDIGGISLIRAAAKNYNDVLIVSSKSQYSEVIESFIENGNANTFDQRKEFAAQAFALTSHYDTAIEKYFNPNLSDNNLIPLRYGENPHQKGWFSGKLNDIFDQLHGKAISYNNLLDIDAAVMLMEDFKQESPTFAIMKHIMHAVLQPEAHLMKLILLHWPVILFQRLGGY